MLNPLLELNHVYFSYQTPSGETPVISNISFSIHPHEFLGLIGPSGCGKSTLLSLIFGLLSPSSGTIKNYIPHDKNHPPCGYMLQKDHLFEWRSIYKNMILGLEIQHCHTPQKEAFILHLLQEYGLMPFKNARPSQLSGGMRQRAALIRTLALEPSLLLLDEPFSALDAQTRLSVSEDIFNILKKEKKSAVLITHDIAEAISFCHRIIILSERPAYIQKIISLPDELKNASPLHARNIPEFQTYFKMIWEELHHDSI